MSALIGRRIAIIGAGAMGSVYAAIFAEAGAEVVAIDRDAAHVAAIAARGLRLEGFSGDRTVRGVVATRDPAAAAGAEMIVIATKADGAAAAAAAVAPHLGDSVALTLQNGLWARERVAPHLPADRLCVGVAQGFGASLIGPGHAHHNGMARVMLSAAGETSPARAEAVAALWRGAGFRAEVHVDADALVWEKFVFNVAFSAPCTVFDRRVGALLADPASRFIALGAAAEADAAARAKGVALGYADVEAYVLGFAQGVLGARPSMALDHAERRRSEIDVINGAVPVEAERLGLAAPINTVLAAAVRAREATF